MSAATPHHPTININIAHTTSDDGFPDSEGHPLLAATKHIGHVVHLSHCEGKWRIFSGGVSVWRTGIYMHSRDQSLWVVCTYP